MLAKTSETSVNGERFAAQPQKAAIMTTFLSEPTTVTLEADLIREALIALRERAAVLSQEIIENTAIGQPVGGAFRELVLQRRRAAWGERLHRQRRVHRCHRVRRRDRGRRKELAWGLALRRRCRPGCSRRVPGG